MSWARRWCPFKCWRPERGEGGAVGERRGPGALREGSRQRGRGAWRAEARKARVVQRAGGGQEGGWWCGMWRPSRVGSWPNFARTEFARVCVFQVCSCIRVCCCITVVVVVVVKDFWVCCVQDCWGHIFEFKVIVLRRPDPREAQTHNLGGWSMA